MGECGVVARGADFGESLGHPGKAELGELIKYRVGQQCPFSLTG
jgi:hypothetical protein